MRIILFGPPGAGKGTQAGIICMLLEIAHISTGDILRKAAEEKTSLGLQIKKYIDQGHFVPDDLIVEIIKRRIKAKDCKKGFILDGFPRTISQAEALGKMLTIDKVIHLNIGNSVAMERLTGRRTCGACGALYHVISSSPKREGTCDKCGEALSRREDDKKKAILRRLEIYRNQTEPLVGYYKKKRLLLVVDGQKSKEQVTRNLLDLILK
jgi:adenylate kinase